MPNFMSRISAPCPNPNSDKTNTKGEKSRERHLGDEEIKAIWNAAADTPYPFGPYVRLLLTTGRRRQEISGMRWDQIDGAIWTFPATATKSNRKHSARGHLKPP